MISILMILIFNYINFNDIEYENIGKHMKASK